MNIVKNSPVVYNVNHYWFYTGYKYFHVEVWYSLEQYIGL